MTFVYVDVDALWRWQHLCVMIRHGPSSSISAAPSLAAGTLSRMQRPPPPANPNIDKTIRTKSGYAAAASSGEVWPALPQTCQASEPQQGICPLNSNVAAGDEMRERDSQVITMLRSLTNVMRLLLTNMDTPAARSALQVLDALTPVLETIV